MDKIAILTSRLQPLEAGTYTAEDLAELWQCSLRHVRRMDAMREIPGRICFGRLVRFSRREIDRYISTESAK